MKKLTIYEKTIAVLFSIFSVIFSMSIVKELTSHIESYFLVVLAIFIASFLVYNEVVKVRELKKLFKKEAYNGYLLGASLFLSIVLSSVGIYFWVNKTHDISNEILVNKSQELAVLESEYILDTEDFENTQEYLDLKSNIEFWMTKSAGTLAERTQIRERIDSYQRELINSKSGYNQNVLTLINKRDDEKAARIEAINAKYDAMFSDSGRNNRISLLFLTLIVITEGLIILLNRDLSHKQLKLDEYNNSELIKNYRVFKNILSTLYLTKKKNSKVIIGMFQQSYINTKDRKTYIIPFEQMKMLYNSMVAAGTLRIKDLITGEGVLLCDYNDAIKKLDHYHKIVRETT
jgi:hypothetical protein